MQKSTDAVTAASPCDEYQARLTRAVAGVGRASRTSAACGRILYGCSACYAVLLLGVTTELISTRAGIIASCVLAVAATAVLIIKSRADRLRTRQRRYQDINEQAVARFKREWKKMPDHSPDPADSSLPIVADLDLVGPVSLARMTCTAELASGRRLLGHWLTHAASPGEIIERQDSVRTLSPLLDWRQELQYRCGRLRSRQRVVDRLCGWSTDPRPACPAIMIRLAVPLAVLSLSFLVGLTSGVLAPQWAFVGLLIVLAINLGVTSLWAGTIHTFLADISPTAAGLDASSLSQPFAHLSTAEFGVARLKALTRSSREAQQALHRLEQLLSLANLRRQPWTMMFVYVPLQLLVLWDFHIVRLLERWKQRYGNDVRSWFDALAETEALCSLASLAYDHPEWCYAAIDTDADRIVAEGLGHPLLPNDQRVANDVTVGPRGSVLIVTGSNMSGKSTLLRSVGVNVMLAQAGGPVCATSLRIPPVVVATSMRITDSLTAGQSLFMAELLRLKEIIEIGRRLDQQEQGILLFLLDEILHGTNSGERRIAVVRVLKHLLDSNAMGAISTHDLELVRDPELSDVGQLVHFREVIEEGPDRPEMSFDYQLRPGPASTTNALRLVEMLGLDDR